MSTSATTARKCRARRISLTQARALAAEIISLKRGQKLPDRANLTLGDRIAILLQVVAYGDRSEALGRHPTNLARYERGHEMPFSVAINLCHATGVSLNWLAVGATEQNPAQANEPEVRSLLSQLKRRSEAADV